MTAKNFEKYCKRNELIKIVPTDFSISFHFTNNRVINANHGIDGIIYTKLKKSKNNASLMTSLLEMTSLYYDQYVKKYGTPTNHLYE